MREVYVDSDYYNNRITNEMSRSAELRTYITGEKPTVSPFYLGYVCHLVLKRLIAHCDEVLEPSSMLSAVCYNYTQSAVNSPKLHVFLQLKFQCITVSLPPSMVCPVCVMGILTPQGPIQITRSFAWCHLPPLPGIYLHD